MFVVLFGGWGGGGDKGIGCIRLYYRGEKDPSGMCTNYKVYKSLLPVTEVVQGVQTVKHSEFTLSRKSMGPAKLFKITQISHKTIGL